MNITKLLAYAALQQILPGDKSEERILDYHGKEAFLFLDSESLHKCSLKLKLKSSRGRRLSYFFFWNRASPLSIIKHNGNTLFPAETDRGKEGEASSGQYQETHRLRLSSGTQDAGSGPCETRVHLADWEWHPGENLVGPLEDRKSVV